MLYHLDDPVEALLEAKRVLRPGGLLAVCTSSRFNDPELADVLPGWDAPLVRLPDRDALALFLRGRGLSAADARVCDLQTPMTGTKRGLLAWVA